MVIGFTLPLAPVAKGRPRLGKGGSVFTPVPTRVFEKQVEMLARRHKPKTPIKCGVNLHLVFTVKKPRKSVKAYPISRPDLDNYIKSVVDGLHEFWIDDAQVIHIDAKKVYTEVNEEPSINVLISDVL